jgi:hypothetical protein
LDLTELEKEILSFVSLNKLQEISLGVPIRIPTGKIIIFVVFVIVIFLNTTVIK